TADSGHSPAAPPSGWQTLATLEGHTGAVRGVALSGDGRLLASGSSDGMVKLWEAPGGRLLATLQGHTGAMRGVALSADGRLLGRPGCGRRGGGSRWQRWRGTPARCRVWR